MKISVYIIAFNQVEKIRDCINSVLWADEIIMADSHSTDGTSEIAIELGAKVIHIPFNGYGDLRNQAISHCNGDWIFSLDSDERCTIEVRDEIIKLIDNAPLDIYRVPRKNFFITLIDIPLMNFFFCIKHFPFFEKLGLSVVWIPARVFNPTTHKKIFSRNFIYI